jgi:hypothetical protein
MAPLFYGASTYYDLVSFVVVFHFGGERTYYIHGSFVSQPLKTMLRQCPETDYVNIVVPILCFIQVSS